MLLAYVDESYDASQFVLAAVVVDGASAHAINIGLDRVVASAHDRYGIDPHAEVHAHAMATAKGEWSPLRDDADARVRLLALAVRVAAESGARIAIHRVSSHDVGRTVSSARGLEEAYRQCFRGIAGSLHRFCEDVDEQVVLIADEVNRGDPQRRHLANYRAAGTGDDGATPLDRIVDALHFGPSHASRLLQAADVVSYVMRRAQDGHVRDARAAEAVRAMADALGGCLIGAGRPDTDER